MRRRNATSWRTEADRGDTLIELLIAVTVIGLVVATLLGSLIESTRASVQHRSLATVDTVLKSLAESAKYEIQLQAAGGAGSATLFAQCATSYQVLGPPSPGTGPSGTNVTVVGTGFARSSQLSVTVNSSRITAPVESPTTDASGNPVSDPNGNVSVTFAMPTLVAGSTYPVTISDATGNSTTTQSGFVATSATLVAATAPPVRDYRVALSSLSWWNGSSHAWDAAGPPATCAAADQSGLQKLTFRATAPDGTTDQLDVVVSNPATSRPVITSASTTTFTVGTPGLFQVTSSGQPNPVFTASGSLPSGVLLKPGGQLSGTPAAGSGGIWNIQILSSNSAGSSQQAFTLVVDEAPAFTSAASTSFTVGTQGSFAPVASGYPSPTLAESGALPSGLSFSTSTGTLTGTPASGTAGSYPITFTATNAAGSAAQSFMLTVNQVPVFTSAAAATFTVGTAGPGFTVAASGNPQPTLSLAGTLPAGITFATATGLLNGTPAAGTGGAYNLTFTATNPAGATDQPFALTVKQAPAITSAASTTFTVGMTSTFTPTTTGFPAPTFSKTGSLPTGINFSTSTGALSGTPAIGTAGTYPLTITATNSAGSSSPQSFTLTVNALSTFTSANTTTFTTGTNGSFTVTAAGFPTPTITETGSLPSGVTWNPANNTLSGTPAAGTGGSYSLTFVATNTAGSTSQGFTLVVNQAPAITSPANITFTVGAAGSFTVTGTGYPSPALSLSGTLPAGMSWNASTGKLTGTPSAGSGAPYSVSITASNGVGAAASQTLAIVVNEAPTFTSSAAATFKTGSTGSFTVVAAGYPTPTYSTAGLPNGLTLSSAGVLSGTPAAGTGGTFSVTISATNSAGTGTQAFTIVVNQAPAITTAASTTFTSGTSNTFTFTASGHPTPTFSESGALPSGVTFNALTGALAGTPPNGTSGTYTITVTATNGITPNATQNFTLTLSQPPTITSANTTTFIVGTPGSFTFAASGSGPITYTEVGGLPAGVTLSSAGVLSGTPATGSGGSYALSVTATGAANPPNTQQFTLRVNESPSFTSSPSTTETAGSSLSFTVTASGTPSPTFSTPGPLPTGITLSSGGVLSGTTSQSGTYSFTITATNGFGSNATQPFTLTVGTPPTITTTQTSTTFTTTAVGTFTFMASGSPTPTWSESGALPGGVTLSSGGVLSGTATVGGSFPITVTATNTFGSTSPYNFTLTVNDPPKITSTNPGPQAWKKNTTVTSIGVTASGYPTPTITVTGLPAGVTYSNGTISGSPTASKGTSGTVTITATNSSGPAATQTFSWSVS